MSTAEIIALIRAGILIVGSVEEFEAKVAEYGDPLTEEQKAELREINDRGHGRVQDAFSEDGD
jgi:hypothetical protein